MLRAARPTRRSRRNVQQQMMPAMSNSRWPMAESEKKAVGYGRPPEHTRFKKGTSGNPAGRRRKVEGDRVDVAAVLETPLPVKQGGNTRNMGTFEIIM